MSDVTETVEEVVEAVEPKEAKAPKSVAKLEEEGDIAADYLEGLLDIADLDGDIDSGARWRSPRCNPGADPPSGSDFNWGSQPLNARYR